jgi:hypothetical protein
VGPAVVHDHRVFVRDGARVVLFGRAAHVAHVAREGREGRVEVAAAAAAAARGLPRLGLGW